MLKGFVVIDCSSILNILKAKLVGHQYKLCLCVLMLYATVLPGYSQSKNIFYMIYYEDNNIIVKVKIEIHTF